MCPEGALQPEISGERSNARNRNRKPACPGRTTSNGSRSRAAPTTRKAESSDAPWYRHKTRPPLTNEEKIKSEMCRNLEERGHCCYGIGCKFAHDKSELKIVIRHPKHKTQLCNDYHGKPALCLFGSRCSYIHESGPRLREFNSVDTGSGSSELMNSPLFRSRLQRLEETINEYSLDTVRTILKRKGVSQHDIRDIEKLPSVVLRLLRRALTSPYANQIVAPAPEKVERPKLVQEEESIGVEHTWSALARLPKNILKAPEFLTPPEDYLSSFAVYNRGA